MLENFVIQSDESCFLVSTALLFEILFIKYAVFYGLIRIEAARTMIIITSTAIIPTRIKGIFAAFVILTSVFSLAMDLYSSAIS